MNDPQLSALLMGAKDYPEDDVRRLVLADWLEEHGDPRGEYVRLQCELARPAGGTSRRGELAARKAQLREKYAARWFAPLEEVFTVHEDDNCRGLINVTAHASRFRTGKCAAALATDAFTWVERVIIVVGRNDQGGVAALAQSPNLSSVRDLQLNSPGTDGILIGDEGVRALSTSAHLANLSCLRLAKNEIGDDGMGVLAGAGWLTNLRHLDLSDNRIGPAGIEVLCSLRVWTALTDLNLAMNEIGDGAQMLAGWPPISSLKVLRLGYNRIGDAGVRALAESPLLAGLVHLDLRSNPVREEGAMALASSPHLDKLEILDLGGASIGEAGIGALRDRYGERVHLSGGGWV